MVTPVTRMAVVAIRMAVVVVMHPMGAADMHRRTVVAVVTHPHQVEAVDIRHRTEEATRRLRM